MSGRPDPFWICHECRAEMRPVRLDSDVNPDPFHELPPPPPIRPQSSPPIQSDYDAHDAHAHQDGGGFFQSLMNNFLGAAVDPNQERTGDRPSSTPTSPGRNSGGNSGRAPGGLRTWEFNFGGGRGSVQFGTIQGGGGGMGPFGPAGSGDDDERGLGGFFPGFAVPPNAQSARPFNPYENPAGRGWTTGGQGGPVQMDDLMRALMGMLADDGMNPMFLGPTGPRGQANLGDYVMTQHGFDQILEQLMHAAGPQGPIPASDVVIEGLPRFKLTDESLEKSQFKDCPVCKDDFTIGEEVMKIPCGHLFHPDCLQPWLKTNGSCPVCRFSLVPDESNEPQTSGPSTQADPPEQPAGDTTPRSADQNPSIFQNVLHRLWGQSGTSNPSSPVTETVPSGSGAESIYPAPRTADQTRQAPTASPHPLQSGATQLHTDAEVDNPNPGLSSAIPQDYRERHRQREQQQQQQQQQQQRSSRSGRNDPDDDYPSYVA